MNLPPEVEKIETPAANGLTHLEAEIAAEAALARSWYADNALLALSIVGSSFLIAGLAIGHFLHFR